MSIISDMINSIEHKYRARVVIVNQQEREAVLIHALTEAEAKNCWTEIEETINSNLVVEKNIPLTFMKVRYLEVKCKDELQNMKKNSLEVVIPNNDSKKNSIIKVKGTVNQVKVVEETLRELFECEYYETEFEVECDKSFIEMWRKRWKQIIVQQEQLFDILIEFVPKSGQSSEIVTFYVCGCDKEGIEKVQTMISTRECRNCIKKKIVELPKDGAITLSKELKTLEIGHLNVVVPCE